MYDRLLKHVCLLWLGICCLVTARAQDTLFRFALVSDTHVGSGSGAEDLERTVADINAQPDIAFVMFSGDITEFGSDEELQLASGIIRKLNKPWHIIPGNHDTKWSESGCNTFRQVFGGETFSFQHQGYWFLGTNCGPNMRMGPGQVPRENIVWLDQQLQQQPDKNIPVIYVNHYPQDSGLNNWYEVLDRLRNRNVKAILCGHGHSNHAFDFEGMPGVMCRSNLRAKAAIGGYNIVSLTKNDLVFNERRPGDSTLPAWHSVNITAPHTPQAHPPRPVYDMNKEYPQVRVKWSLQEQGDIGSAVAVADGKVIYTNTNGDIKAVQLKSGKPVWTYTAKGKIYATPLVSGKYVIVPCTDEQVYCLDLRTGKPVWSQATGKAIVASAAAWKDLVIVAGSDGHCRAWETATGKPRWDFDSVRNFVETRPLIYQDKVFFGSWGNQFYALDAATGKQLWNWSNGASNRMFSAAACWPVASAGTVYLVAPDRYMTALNATGGQPVWRYRDSASYVRESMGLSEDSSRVYVKTMQGKVLALNARAAERKLIWTSPVEMGYEICPSPINEHKGTVYVPGQSGVIYALSAQNGALQWRYKISNCLVNTVQPVDAHTVLTSSADGKLLCLEVK